MIARAAVSLVPIFLVATLFRAAHTQPTSIWVDVAPKSEETDEVEKRYTPELISELKSANDDALLLYTEYSARSGADLKIFLTIISGLRNETIGAFDKTILDKASESCRNKFEKRLKKIEHDATRAASFSAENHHKFFLGHMIVFRMHLNKSEDYIKKCDRVVKNCGIPCETTPRVIRWRRLAAEEIHRVRDDIQHSRKSYRDLLLHAHRKLNRLRRQATARAREAVENLQLCAQREITLYSNTVN